MNMTAAEKTAAQAELLGNRLRKRYKYLRKWAKRSNVSCFRLYDKDIPEIPLGIDVYESYPDGEVYAQVALYERPYQKDESEEEYWLSVMHRTVANVLLIHPDNVALKVRKKQRGEAQYEKQTDARDLHIVVREQNVLFEVNLSSYLDTGLFFDHRYLRNKVRAECAGKNVLNLYCYTGAFSLYAAQGKARHIDSVDLSKTYLAWARRNFVLNGFSVPEDDEAAETSRFQFIQQDSTLFLENALKAQKKWDIIILDPPTFSNSKRTKTTLDINRDWQELVRICLQLLEPGGVLYFSTNSRRLAFDETVVHAAGGIVSDISAETIPEDFRNMKIHRCWCIMPDINKEQ